MVAILAPWVVYNATRFEKVELLSSQFGATFRDSNCPATYYGARLGWVDVECRSDPPPTARAPAAGDESARDLQWRQDAFRYMNDHRSRVPVVVAARVGRLWQVYRPIQQMAIEPPCGNPERPRRLAFYAFWLLLPTALAGAFVLQARSVSLLPFVALAAIVTITAAVTVGLLRYRAAAEVPIVLLSAVAVDALWRSLSPTRRSQAGSPAVPPAAGAGSTAVET